ncbi:cytochrome P450 [Aquamicrobium sp.]|uniref:cytochrome P450 n=1 Tax=Aquamicrobium sp. TaxID=1872579 RepID=UPI0025851FE1|nr:cytochrome P450 [Aquamicrobium sp.]MCK9553757.1 cytochrome P450 [Aquamicrobium sp.]
MANPYPYYRKLRQHAPVYYTPKYDTFWLSRFDGLVEMLEKPRNVLLSTESSIPMPEVLLRHHDGKPPLASLDPLAPMTLLHSPIYEEIRFAHSKPFRAAEVAKLEEFTRITTIRLLEDALPRGTFDLFLDYGGMLSALLTCKLFGIEDSSAREILETVNATTSYDPDRGGIDNSLFFSQMKRFMLPSIARRRAEGADGSEPLFDGLINYRMKPGGRALSDDEIADELTCAFIANTETPGKVAAQGLLALQQHPDQLAAVRCDLAVNVPVAVEEMLRLCAPAQWFLRTIHEDTEIGGVSMKAGQRVAGLVTSASRDEREYENSEEFIWNRRIRKQLAFGMGLHHCLGLHIARLQIRILVEEFLARVDHYSFDLGKAVLRPSYFHWAYSSLPVTVASHD